MNLNREEKEKAVAALREKFEKVKGVVFTEYKGLTVAEISDLRDILRANSIEYRVVKNTLARKASEGTPVHAGRDSFAGPVGLAMDYADSVRVAREIVGFSKKNEKLKVSCGVIDGVFYGPDQLRKVSELPSRDVLLSMFAGALNAPAGKLARLLNATVSRFAYALNALKEKKAGA